VRIQAYLTAAVITLKRLAAALVELCRELGDGVMEAAYRGG
jgi:hypothetical protein